MTNLFDKLFNRIDLNDTELAELIQTIKKSGKLGILQEIVSTVKEEYFISDRIHGINHNLRVMVLSAYIGIKEGLSDNELKLLLYSAVYHDIGRKGRFGKEKNHGSRSAELLEQNKNDLLSDFNQEEIDYIKALCIVHSSDDARMYEIAKENGVRDITSFIKTAQILKDADALDRVRLPKFGKLNEKYLRTDISKKIIDIARKLFFETMAVNENDKKPSMTLENEDYIFLFRSLTEEDIQDRENGYKGIRPNNLRTDNTSQTWEPFKDREKLMLDELYKHVRKQYGGRYTNCISLTDDANVCLTYYPENERYVIVCIPKKDKNCIVHAGHFFIQELNKLLKGIDVNEQLKNLFDKIENAKSNEELGYILKSLNEQIPIGFLSPKQYLSEKEELDNNKVISKIKVLEEYGLIDNIIDGIENEFLYVTIGNAFSSAEYIHYGAIDEQNIIECPKEYMDILSLIQQAKFNGIDNRTIQRITNKVIKLIQDGHNLENSGITSRDLEIISNQYSKKDKLNGELDIESSFNLTDGSISYIDTMMQATAIRVFAEALLRKRILVDFLKKSLPEENFDEIFDGTYCLNPEFLIRRSGRGAQISNSVNVLVTENGMDLDNENIKRLLASVSMLSNNQLEDILLNGINSEVLKKLLIKRRDDKKRIEQYQYKNKKTKYYAEAIIEAYDWKKIRGALTKAEKTTLAKAIINTAQRDDLERLYNTLQTFYIDDERLTKEEIYAIIINLAIGERRERVLYKRLLSLSSIEQKNELEQNVNLLQTSINPVSIDILMKRGKSIERIKQKLIRLGVPEEFIDKKDLRNLYTAQEIVKKYNWRKGIGRKLSNKEKSAIIQIILSNERLNIEGTVYLTCLMNKLESLGLSQNEINGYIINLATNRSINGASYTAMINGLIKKKDFIIYDKDKDVSEITILRAVSETLSNYEQEEFKKYLASLGISRRKY